MEEINEWQQIEHHTALDSSGWTRVNIKENNIELQGGSDQSSSSSSSSAPNNHEEDGISSSMTASSPLNNQEGETPTPVGRQKPLDWAYEGKKLMKAQFEAMRVETLKVASKVRNCAMCAGVFWSITYATGAAAVTALLVLAYIGIQRRRHKLTYLLRQKDEKISQLLLHIAHLNEALSSRRKVPVYQIGG